jgi:hypothetical protein
MGQLSGEQQRALETMQSALQQVLKLVTADRPSQPITELEK